MWSHFYFEKMNISGRWTGSLSVGEHQSGAWRWQVNWMAWRGLIEEIVRRWNHKIIEIEYKEEGQKSSEWRLGFWWWQLGGWWDIQERRQVLIERGLSFVHVVTLRCLGNYLEGCRVCSRYGLVDRGRRWNWWCLEVRGGRWVWNISSSNMFSWEDWGGRSEYRKIWGEKIHTYTWQHIFEHIYKLSRKIWKRREGDCRYFGRTLD